MSEIDVCPFEKMKEILETLEKIQKYLQYEYDDNPSGANTQTRLQACELMLETQRQQMQIATYLYNFEVDREDEN